MPAWPTRSLTRRPSSPPNSSSQRRVSVLPVAAAAGPPYSFCGFSPHTMSLMPICTASRTGSVKIVTCSGHEMSPTWHSASLLTRRRTTWFVVYSTKSTPSDLRFSMLRRPMSESSSVVAVTHSGFMPSSSMRIACVVESLPPLTPMMQS